MKINKLPFALLTALAFTGMSHGALIWSQGTDDNAQDGDGDPLEGLNDTSNYFGSSMPGSGVQEIGTNTLPGNPANTGGANGDPNRDIDDDYYFEGDYGGTIGIVGREQYWERAITDGDSNLRYHFNVPAALALGSPGSDTYVFTIDFFNMSIAGGGEPTAGYDLTVWVDGTQVGGTQTHDASTTGTAQSWSFPVSALGGAAEQGPGFNHYVEVRSAANHPDSQWASLDYAQLELVPEPTSGLLLGLSLVPLFLRRRRR